MPSWKSANPCSRGSERFAAGVFHLRVINACLERFSPRRTRRTTEAHGDLLATPGVGRVRCFPFPWLSMVLRDLRGAIVRKHEHKRTFQAHIQSRSISLLASGGGKTAFLTQIFKAIPRITQSVAAPSLSRGPDAREIKVMALRMGGEALCNRWPRLENLC